MSKLSNYLGLQGAVGNSGPVGPFNQISAVNVNGKPTSIVQQMSGYQDIYNITWYRMQEELELERLRILQAEQRFAGKDFSPALVKEMIGIYPRKMLLLL